MERMSEAEASAVRDCEWGVSECSSTNAALPHKNRRCAAFDLCRGDKRTHDALAYSTEQTRLRVAAEEANARYSSMFSVGGWVNDLQRALAAAEERERVLVAAGNRMEHVLSHSAGANDMVRAWRAALARHTDEEG